MVRLFRNLMTGARCCQRTMHWDLTDLVVHFIQILDSTHPVRGKRQIAEAIDVVKHLNGFVELKHQSRRALHERVCKRSQLAVAALAVVTFLLDVGEDVFQQSSQGLESLFVGCHTSELTRIAFVRLVVDLFLQGRVQREADVGPTAVVTRFFFTAGRAIASQENLHRPQGIRIAACQNRSQNRGDALCCLLVHFLGHHQHACLHWIELLRMAFSSRQGHELLNQAHGAQTDRRDRAFAQVFQHFAFAFGNRFAKRMEDCVFTHVVVVQDAAVGHLQRLALDEVRLASTCALQALDRAVFFSDQTGGGQEAFVIVEQL